MSHSEDFVVCVLQLEQANTALAQENAALAQDNAALLNNNNTLQQQLNLANDQTAQVASSSLQQQYTKN
jgi:hypothetical protein